MTSNMCGISPRAVPGLVWVAPSGFWERSGVPILKFALQYPKVGLYGAKDGRVTQRGCDVLPRQNAVAAGDAATNLLEEEVSL